MYAVVFCIDETAIDSFLSLTPVMKRVLLHYVRHMPEQGIDKQLRVDAGERLYMRPPVLGKAEAALIRQGFFHRDGADRWVVNTNKIYTVKRAAGGSMEGVDVDPESAAPVVAKVNRQMTVDDRIRAVDAAEADRDMGLNHG